jgi:hypothetical protein
MTQPAEHRLPPELRGVLEDLRARIRRYVLIEGISLIVVVLCGLFWISWLTDWAYFRVARLELPGWFRTAFFVAMLCCLAAGIVTWIVARLLRRLRSRALALVLEKRFPQLDDRLITAVELMENGDADSPGLTSAMQRQTLRDAAASVKSLDVASVFDRRPLNRALFAAVLLAVSVAGLGIANAAAVGRWYNAFVRGEDNYWDPFRKSALSVAIVAQPGERVRPLSMTETYRHPRGADLVVLVDVPEDKLVPEQVTLHYRTHGQSGSGRGRVTMTQIGERTFRHALTRAVDDHHLWVVGGDFANRAAYRIEAVDPPAIDRIRLDCDYPDYTGMDAFADQQVRVQGAQVSLPVGTRFQLQADANKPLVGLRVRCPHFELLLAQATSGADTSSTSSDAASSHDLPPARLTIRSARDDSTRTLTVPPELQQQWLVDDGRGFSLPLVVAPDAGESLTAMQGAPRVPLPIPPDVPLQFELFDADGIQSSEPIRLTINGIIDLPPSVETRLKGIGRSITRLAGIPVEGTITDDYGVVGARFGYRVDDAAEYEFARLSVAPRGQKEFTLGGNSDPAVERFLVRPLELSVGQKLILTLFAGDANDVTGPHESHGEVYSFNVVSAEELLAQLYDKEMNLRQRFEQIIAEVQETREDLAVQRERNREVAQLRSGADGSAAGNEQLQSVRSALDAAADRRLNAIRKNHTETRSIEQMFGEIRAEMVNNRVDTSTALQRIDEGIVAPLHEVNEIDYPEIDRNLALFKLVNEEGQDPTGQIDRSLAAIDEMLQRMNDILREMRRRETYNELVKRLQSILETQQQIRDETNRARMRSLIEGQFDFGDSQ